MPKMPVCDCCYNIDKQLSKSLQLLWNLQGYKANSKKCKHTECLKVWDEVEKNTTKTAEVLKKAAAMHAAKRGLC